MKTMVKELYRECKGFVESGPSMKVEKGKGEGGDGDPPKPPPSPP